MSGRSVEHATFVVERTYDTSAARVFAAWATPTNTGLGGLCCKPIAWRKIASTIIKRVKQVIIISMAGIAIMVGTAGKAGLSAFWMWNSRDMSCAVASTAPRP